LQVADIVYFAFDIFIVVNILIQRRYFKPIHNSCFMKKASVLFLLFLCMLSAQAQTPKGGTPRSVPGIIQAEDYDDGPAEVAFHNNVPENQNDPLRPPEVENGHLVSTSAGEWMKYTVNVSQTGTYTLRLRAATNNNDGLAYFEIGQTSATIAVANTGGSNSYQNFEMPVTLTAGVQVVKFIIAAGIYDIDYFEFISTGSNPGVQVPVISSSVNSLNVTTGVAFSHTITASNKPGNFTVDGIPQNSGINFTISNNVLTIAGTPVNAGTSSVAVPMVVRAYNEGGESQPYTFTVNILPQSSGPVGPASWTTGSGGIFNNPLSSNVGIGTANPQAKLDVAGAGMSTGSSGQFNGDLIIQANTGSRNETAGAALEFVIPANTDGSNMWGQARIMTVAGNANSGNATGKMIFGTRRHAGGSWLYGSDITIDGNGAIGIGKTNPAFKLDVEGHVQVSGFVKHTGNAWTGAAGNLIAGNPGDMNSLGLRADNNIIFGKSGGVETIRIDGNGNLGIGTTDTKGYKLAVAGEMIAEKMVVKKQVNWPDYVFDPAYKLPTLISVADFVKDNQHLPNIPSASQISKNGIDLAETQTLLLQKIEELTLYAIAQEKQLELQKKIQHEQMKTMEDKLQIVLKKLEAMEKK